MDIGKHGLMRRVQRQRLRAGSKVRGARSTPWPRNVGLLLGMGVWVSFVILDGGMAVTRSIPALEGQGPPILLGRTSVNSVASRAMDPNDYREAPRGSEGIGESQDTEGQVPLLMVDRVNAALEIEGVRKSLGLATVTKATSALPQAVPSKTTRGFLGPTTDAATPIGTGQVVVARTATPEVRQTSASVPAPTPATPTFSFADNLAPGRPAASVVNFVNGSKAPLSATVRPIVLSDTGLCRVLRVAVAITAKGQKPIVLETGDLLASVESGGLQLALKPGVEYTSVVLFNLPTDIGNAYQGRTCTVDVLLDLGNPTS